MPRYSNKVYKRRVYRKNKKTLSTKNIYSRRSAKAQANQINALKKRITSINRRLRPEIHTHMLSQVWNKTLSSALAADSYWSGFYQWPTRGTGEAGFIGNKFNMLNMYVYFNFEYYNNSQTGYHNSESSGTPIRIIVLKTKQMESLSNQPTLNDLLVYSSATGNDYTMRALSPYKDGTADRFRIMYDRTFYMTTDKNQKLVKVSLGRSRIEFDPDASTGIQYYYYVAPAGLHYDSNFQEFVNMTISAKIAYTDY